MGSEMCIRDSFSLSQLASLYVWPVETPRIWVCTAPLTPTVHRSELLPLIEGDIALGGGLFTVVLVSESVLTVLLLVLSVTIGFANAELADITHSDETIAITTVMPFQKFIVFSSSETSHISRPFWSSFIH